jgi:hypothetical protein
MSSTTGYETIHCKSTQRWVGVAWQRHTFSAIGSPASAVSLDLQCQYEHTCPSAQHSDCPLNQLRRGREEH